MSVDVSQYVQPSPIVRGALELTPAGELLAETLSGQIAQIWRDIVETGDPQSETVKGLIAKQAELEEMYEALTANTVPGAHGAVMRRAG